jgi:hypothetical protein
MVATFTIQRSRLRREFMLHIAKPSAKAAATGPAEGAEILCLNASESTNRLPTLLVGSPWITGTTLDAQWTVHQTYLFETDNAGQWVQYGHTPWIFGKADYGSPVSSWGDAGWWIWNGAAWWSGKSVDWTHTGTGWFRVVHKIYWMVNGSWSGGGWTNGLHHDTHPPGGAEGGGPTAAGNAYNYCYIE